MVTFRHVLFESGDLRAKAESALRAQTVIDDFMADWMKRGYIPFLHVYIASNKPLDGMGVWLYLDLLSHT